MTSRARSNPTHPVRWLRVATHDGAFHADETFAIAGLGRIETALEVVRSRDPAAIRSCDLRVDVGFSDDADHGNFDHHQHGATGVRESGVRFASFGLVWRTYGDAICSSAEIALRVDEILVRVIDAVDNGQQVAGPAMPGVVPLSLSGLLSAFNPPWDVVDVEFSS